MPFSSLECAQRGRVALPPGLRGGAVHADDFGGVWVITADGLTVLFYAATALEAAMHQAPSPTLTSSFASSAAPLAPQPAPFTVAYRCHTDTQHDDDSGEATATASEPQDRIHSLLFFHHRTACDACAPRGGGCLVTTGGTLVFLRVPGAGDAPDGAAAATSQEAAAVPLRPYQEVHLDMRVSATAAMRGALALCCHDGAYTEVIRAAVVPDGEAAGEVDAVGLFRVGGRVAALLHDPAQDILVSVSDGGNVDVWDVAGGRDVTAVYGSLSWEPQRHGPPTCALLCHDRLWVGLTTGHVLVFPFAPRQPLPAASPAEAPPAAQLLRSHTSSVTGLLRMSLGTSVWGCAADSAKVNVWHAVSAELRGSFVFPEAGLAGWQAGAAQLRTAVWGIDAVTGQPSLLQVTQALTDPSGTHVRTGDAVRQELRREALLRAYEVCWRAVVRAFDVSSLRADDAEDAADAIDEAAEVALAFVHGETGEEAATPSGILSDLRAASAGLRRLCATRRWGGSAGEPMNVPAVMAECVAGCEERDRLAHSVQAMLRAVNAAASAAEPPLMSLEDVADEVVHLRGRVDAQEQALSRRSATEADEAVVAAAVEEATGHLQGELLAAQAAVREAHQSCGALQARLEETQRELDTLAAQHAEAQRLLAKSEEQVEQLRRSLLASKRAAEVTATEVSSMFEMESRLRESQSVVAELSSKLDRLLNASEAADAQLRAFGEKQTAAKEVLQRVLHTQNALADDVGGLADVVGAAVSRLKKLHRCEPGGPVAELVETVETAMYEAEVSVEKRLRDQQSYFHSLAHELAAAIT